MLPTAPTTEKAIITNIIPDQQDLQLGLALDQAAGRAMPQTTLKIIYELLLDLAYALFVSAVIITVNLDSTFRSAFTDYLNQPSSKAYIITLVVLGVITLAFAKAYKIDTKLPPMKRKAINFVEDLLRGIIYVIMLIFVTRFVMDHSDVSMLLLSYVLYIVSGGFFFLVRTGKWFYFLCGERKDNLAPWSNTTPLKFQAEGLSASENELVNRLMSGLIENIKKGAITAIDKNKTGLL